MDFKLGIGSAIIGPYLTEEPGIKADQLWRHVLLVHVVEVCKLCAGWEPTLHQVQYRHHTWDQFK